jgi:hypothetical protein
MQTYPRRVPFPDKFRPNLYLLILGLPRSQNKALNQLTFNSNLYTLLTSWDEVRATIKT